MLLTITTTYQPATDLGFLLHKNPDRVQSFPLPFGQAHVFYPEARYDRCTVALLLDMNPIQLVRGKRHALLEHYVNDRPYVASSFLSVALAQIFGSAMGGRSSSRPDLPQVDLPLQAQISVVPCRSGEAFLHRLFEPLGYEVTTIAHPLDEDFPDWGPSPYFTVTLTAECRLQDLLTHLYVLVPVLDDEKHYWIGDDEVEKLLRHGKGWLEIHPERDQIVARYLRHRRSLTRGAIQRLILRDGPIIEDEETSKDASEAQIERSVSLHEQRLEMVVLQLRQLGARRVLDLGCGEGKLLRLLLQDSTFEEIVGLDVSYRSLEIAQKRLKLDELPPRQRSRIKVLHGSLGYRDVRLVGYDAAAIVEVIEHLDPARLSAFERVVFDFARPAHVIITTPNAEYNSRLENLPPGAFRHKDHRFEWTRSQFERWSHEISDRFGYSVHFVPIGPADPDLGAPSQMAVFTRT